MQMHLWRNYKNNLRLNVMSHLNLVKYSNINQSHPCKPLNSLINNKLNQMLIRSITLLVPNSQSLISLQLNQALFQILLTITHKLKLQELTRTSQLLEILIINLPITLIKCQLKRKQLRSIAAIQTAITWLL